VRRVAELRLTLIERDIGNQLYLFVLPPVDDVLPQLQVPDQLRLSSRLKVRQDSFVLQEGNEHENDGVGVESFTFLLDAALVPVF